MKRRGLRLHQKFSVALFLLLFAFVIAISTVTQSSPAYVPASISQRSVMTGVLLVWSSTRAMER